ncbi:MAG: glucose-6-phosphate isomerase [Fusobacterium gastrosuis]|uniref:glucose-6-phosphate isomerase n=1 Tax=Fusobacterium gastrosuis TaxID=1755100 RepID=UPI002A9DA6CA|nr:glucose-6-phosphate isomerase [Fusobacteriaceae bacterium]MDY5795898.1 glucose-6-phosphate isomerase [Fusobacterium gastrosuis]
MKKINLDYSKVFKFIDENELQSIKVEVEKAARVLEEKSGKGNDFLGWLDLPINYDKEEFTRIKKAAEKIKSDSEVLIVVGIGGSYLGARAVIEALSHSFYNSLSKSNRKTPEIYFAGQNISGRYLKHLIEIIGDRDFSVNVISKSGTTTEPAIAFRVFKELLEKKYGEAAKERIYATTDKVKGALKKLADEKGYEKFVIADNIGGRFSVLTAVGLLPIAVAGINIDEIIEGAKKAREDFKANFDVNDCYKYAAIRNILYRKGYLVELLANYDPRVHYISEWWKQLYGESEGKDKKGIFPASVDLTTDLHSMGQYIQDGQRNLMETIINIENTDEDLVIKEEKEDLDGLNYLAGENLSYINSKAFEGTLLAHIDGGVPCMVINIPEMNPFNMGYLIYFFEKACAVSGYILDVNPFDQPGVESYKKNMFALLGKKGYEELSKELNERLKK